MLARYLTFFSIILLIELYFIYGMRGFVQDFSQNKKNLILYTVYGLFIVNMTLGLVGIFYPPPSWNGFFRILSAACIILVVCKLLGDVFFLLDDIIRLFRWIFSLFRSKSVEVTEAATKISRLKFLTGLAVTFTVIPAIGFLYGVVRGAYRYKVHNVKVPSPNIPEEFNGFKIVQLSDIHTGSFMDNSALNRAFDIVMEQKADLILFTGDLVNNKAEETTGFEKVYEKLKAPHGVYSVLGNHDYGDYVPEWREDRVAKAKNLEELKQVQKNAGWRLLMNEHVAIDKNGQKIALIGIENWGAKIGFPQYGKMNLAHKDTSEYPFKILMSHDPSHWDNQVLTDYPDVDLTLSGHTHGMQLGIEIPGFKWSPVKYIYKNWAGLYKSGQQFLYVNRGLGFLGYPGRLGIWPEITVIELQKV